MTNVPISARRFLQIAAIGLVPLVPTAAAQTTRTDSLNARSLAVKSVKDYLGVVGNRRVFESGRITDRERDAIRRMVAGLDSAGRLSPRDQDIVTVRAYNLTITGNHTAALSVVTEGCTESEWWCSALLGFIQQGAWKFDESEKHFDRAISFMPRERRCLWTDISLIANDHLLINEYSKVPCEERHALDMQIWALADPLWIDPGSERRVAHFSRWMNAELVRRELEFLRLRPLDTDRVTRSMSPVIRHGKLEWWNGVRIGCGIRGRFDCNWEMENSLAADRFVPTWAGFSRRYSFGPLDYGLAPVPGGLYMQLNSDVSVPPWTLNGNEGAPSRNGPSSTYEQSAGGYGETYVSPFGKVHTIVDAQTGFLLRGNEAQLVAAFVPKAAGRYAREDYRGCVPHEYPDLCTSGSFFILNILNARLRSGIAFLEAGQSSPRVVVAPSHSEIVRLSMHTQADSGLLSVEASVVDTLDRPFAFRHRFAVFRPDIGVSTRTKMSDILMFAPPAGGVMPSNADELLTHMLPRSTINRTESVGLYWELYGLHRGELPEFELTISARDTTSGIFTSIAQRLGLATRKGSVLMKWSPGVAADSTVATTGRAAYTLVVGFASLVPGDYYLEMTSRVSGDTAVHVSKPIRIR